MRSTSHYSSPGRRLAESEDYEENTGGTEKSKANKGERSLFIAREGMGRSRGTGGRGIRILQGLMEGIR